MKDWYERMNVGEVGLDILVESSNIVAESLPLSNDLEDIGATGISAAADRLLSQSVGSFHCCDLVCQCLFHYRVSTTEVWLIPEVTGPFVSCPSNAIALTSDMLRADVDPTDCQDT